MLAIGRALMLKPQLLLMDELSLGLSRSPTRFTEPSTSSVGKG